MNKTVLQNVILNEIHFNTFEGGLMPGALNYWMYFLFLFTGRLLAQQCWELLCVRLHVAKCLTGFKLCSTTLNNMQ